MQGRQRKFLYGGETKVLTKETQFEREVAQPGPNNGPDFQFPLLQCTSTNEAE